MHTIHDTRLSDLTNSNLALVAARETNNVTTLAFETMHDPIALVDITRNDFMSANVLLESLTELDETKNIALSVQRSSRDVLSSSDDIPVKRRHRDIRSVLAHEAHDAPFQVDPRHALTLAYFLAYADKRERIVVLEVAGTTYLGRQNDALERHVEDLLQTHDVVHYDTVRYRAESRFDFTHRRQTASYVDKETNVQYVFEADMATTPEVN